LANTCHWSRREPFAPNRLAGSGLTRDTILLPIKKVRSAAPPGSPVPIRMALPIAVAARTPIPVRARRPKASKAMVALTRKLAGAEREPRGGVKGLIG